MTIDEWARQNMGGNPYEHDWGQRLSDFTAGAETLADALLSDEAVGAAARAIVPERFPVDKMHILSARAAIQAAIDAVTKGDTE